MAEIRKHNPRTRDQIDAAILAALGEDVHHTAPGERPQRLSKTAAPKPQATSAFAVGLATSGWTVVDPKAVAKPTAAAPEPDEDDQGDD